jgi:hypothetical protein
MKRLLLAWLALLALVYGVVWRSARMPSPHGPSEAELAGAATAFAAWRDGRPPPSVAAAALGGPLFVRLFSDGKQTLRLRSDASDLAAAVAELGPRLAGAQGTAVVDAVTARASALSLSLPVAGLALGQGGVAARAGDGEVVLLTDELARAHLPAQLTFADVEVNLGVAPSSVMAALRAVDGRSTAPQRLAERRAVEGDRAPDVLDAPSLRAAALAAGQYLTAHLDGAGRFDYRYFPDADESPADRDVYSLPRHGGASWLLARLADRPEIAAAAERALGWLVEQHPRGQVAIGEPDEAETSVPASALTLVALAELARHRPLPARLSEAAAALAAELVAMQRPDGDFHHVRRAGAIDPTPRLLYASGEAAFALALWRRVAPPTDHPALDRSLERAVAALVGDRPFFLTFVFLEDHWTCLAADAAWPSLSPQTRTRAVEHCRAFGRFLGRFQHHSDSITAAHPSLDGAYGFTPVIPPHTTPSGSRAEALAAILRLERAAGQQLDADLVEQLRASVGFLRRGQLRAPRDTFAAPRPSAVPGGWLFVDDAAPGIDRHIRIDTVQHCASALLDAADLQETARLLW